MKHTWNRNRRGPAVADHILNRILKSTLKPSMQTTMMCGQSLASRMNLEDSLGPCGKTAEKYRFPCVRMRHECDGQLAEGTMNADTRAQGGACDEPPRAHFPAHSGEPRLYCSDRIFNVESGCGLDWTPSENISP
jgi:hypothetical protein